MTKIYYHFPCQDGFGSAWIAHRKFGKGAEYIPINYGDALDPDSFTGHVDTDVYFIDYAPDRQTLLSMKERCKSVTVLDHHLTALKSISDIDGVYLDMNKSAAVLTWEHFFPGETIPWFIERIQDYDLFRFAYSDCEAIHEAISLVGFTFEAWDTIEGRKEELFNVGESLLKYRENLCRDILSHTQYLSIGGFDNVPTVNSLNFNSSLGELLLQRYQNAPFVAVYFDRRDGKRKWSFRSKPDRQDVCAIAESYGGGGHRNASGFVEKIPGSRILPKTPYLKSGG